MEKRVPHPVRPELGTVTEAEATEIMKHREEAVKLADTGKKNFYQGPGNSLVSEKEMTEADFEALAEQKREKDN